MIKITRKYHFYAAHRNQLLQGKCTSLHGHQYNVEVQLIFNGFSNGICAMKGKLCSFEKIDEQINPIIDKLDHSCLIDINDPLLKYLKMFEEEQNEKLKLNIFNDVTSVENVSRFIFEEVCKKGFTVSAVSVQETNSAIVTYER